MAQERVELPEGGYRLYDYVDDFGRPVEKHLATRAHVGTYTPEGMLVESSTVLIGSKT